MDDIWERSTSPRSHSPTTDGYTINETSNLLCEDEQLDLGRGEPNTC